MYTLGHLESIRLHELNRILPALPPAAALLEIGAGTGWQSKRLAELGHRVSAIDLPTSNYKEQQIWPVTEYDGFRIPFPAERFDLVYSSNVLEHIPHVVEFQSEIHRVLKPGGTAVHILPSGTWRFWTTVAHYPALVQRLFASLGGSSPAPADSHHGASSGIQGHQSLVRRLLSAAVPPRHGECGNAATEMYYFSKRRWARLFEKTGWRIEKYFASSLFYTGYGLLDRRLPLSARQTLSNLFGSACHVFVLKSDKKSPQA